MPLRLTTTWPMRGGPGTGSEGMLPWGSVLRQGPGQACDVNKVGVNVNGKKVIRKFGWINWCK